MMSDLNNTTLLNIEDLGFRWPKTNQDTLAISRIHIQQGETAFLYGPSGCGKSTLLSLVGGVLTASRGAVRLLGHDWQQLSSSQRDRLRADHVGFIFQQFNLLPYLSVLDNVLLACRFSERRSLQAGHPQQTAQRLLEQVGIRSTEWGRKASDLSVGQQQRVAAARALIGQPELVIADEPTSALDERRRDGFMQLLLEQCERSGCALLFVTHDSRLASHFQHTVHLPEPAGGGR